MIDYCKKMYLILLNTAIILIKKFLINYKVDNLLLFVKIKTSREVVEMPLLIEKNRITNAIDVAKFLLYNAYKDGDCITNLKLQKLLYYAQAWYLVNFKKKLFEEPIQAWQYGPVVESVYKKYCKYGNSPITEKINPNHLNLSLDQKDYLTDYCFNFFRYSATELVTMTHREDPWINAYAKGKGSIISTCEMQEFYSALV